MMSGATNSNPNSSRFPFTATQFQELEHQALIYKYMVSNIPVPSDLLFAIKRSCSLDPSRLFARQTPAHIGWSCFQMGMGRKIDPEPGRCRRTDGKKWRCSKEAYPDSKYCERHMHRGKNRSRKPVEIGTQTSSSANPTAVSSITKSNHVVQSNFLMSTSSQSHQFQSQHHHQDSSFPLVLDSAGSFSLSNTNYRSSYGLKEEVDEYAFFSEPSGSMRSLSGTSMEDPWQFTPLTMNSSSSSSSSNPRGVSVSGLQNEYPYLQLRSLNDHDSYSYVNGNLHNEQRQEPEKTVHRFFDDLPPKNRDPWLDLDDKSQNSSTVSTTTLSISIPSPSHEFPIFNSSTRNG